MDNKNQKNSKRKYISDETMSELLKRFDNEIRTDTSTHIKEDEKAENAYDFGVSVGADYNDETALISEEKGEPDVAYKKSQNHSGSRFLKGATILMIAGIFSKVLGAAFRIPLTNWIGAENMSYYGLAYNVYAVFLIITISGFPVAISRMVSARFAVGDYKNAHKTYKVSLMLMFSLGLISFLICFFGAGAISNAMGNPGAMLSLRAISPVLLLSPVVASFRGYSQGQQVMNPTAVSEVVEQFFRVVVGLALSWFLIDTGYEMASAGATFGASAGSAAALAVLFIMYISAYRSRRERLELSEGKEEKSGNLLKELLAIAIPITIGSSIMPLMNLIDAAIIMNRLQSTGWSLKMSKTLFGLISSYCDPLLGFPHVFTDAVAISMVPAVAAAYTIRNKAELTKNIRTGVKTMMVVTYPCCIGMMLMAKPILLLLYPTRPNEVDMATGVLQIFSLGIIGLSVLRTFSSVLQGIGKPGIPVIHLAIGSVAKVIVTYILVGMPFVNIKGAAIGTIATYIITSYLNYRSTRKLTNVRFEIGDTFVRPLAAAGIMGAAAYAVHKTILFLTGRNSIAVLIAIVIAAFVYFVLIFLIGAVKKEEAAMLPGGDFIIRAANKLHLIKD